MRPGRPTPPQEGRDRENLVRTVITMFGTRPEVIKLAPVIHELTSRSDRFRPVNVTSAQHTDLLYPLIEYFGLELHHDLAVMREAQTIADVCSRVVAAFDRILVDEEPDLVLVQGDTTTAMAGALAAFFRKIPVGHVEAGLRSGNKTSPFPEEMNRRLVTKLASIHFAATPKNVDVLRAEGVPEEEIVLTGNPVVDSLQAVLRKEPGPKALDLLDRVDGTKLIALTTHRRESFGEVMAGNLRVLREFVERHDDVSLAFPVHPNPEVRGVTAEILGGVPRVHLLDPLEYFDFVPVLARAWLIVSDSGGVQEEAPTLGKPLLVLRENTERPEAVESGVARLVGGDPERLRGLLEELYPDDPWLSKVREIDNPFGRGDAGKKIVDGIEAFLAGPGGGA